MRCLHPETAPLHRFPIDTSYAHLSVFIFLFRRYIATEMHRAVWFLIALEKEPFFPLASYQLLPCTTRLPEAHTCISNPYTQRAHTRFYLAGHCPGAICAGVHSCTWGGCRPAAFCSISATSLLPAAMLATETSVKG